MPESAHKTLRRHREILKLLEAPGGMPVSLVNTRLRRYRMERSIRTIERDMDVLTAQGLIERITVKKPHHYRVVAGASNRLPGISVAEAIALRLLREELEPLLPDAILDAVRPRFELADRKLAETHRIAGGRPWHEKVSSAPKNLRLVPPKIDRQVLRVVQDALTDDKRLRITYRSLQDKVPGVREIHPRALLVRDGVTYVVSTKDPDDRQLKQYALHRISAIELDNRRVSRISFDLQKYLTTQEYEIGNGRETTFGALVAERLAVILRETPLTEDMTLLAEGDRFRITARLRMTRALERWILGHGSSIEVLEPPQLREAIRTKLTQAAEAYQRRRRSGERKT